jgi:hypothetical protein
LVTLMAFPHQRAEQEQLPQDWLSDTICIAITRGPPLL